MIKFGINGYTEIIYDAKLADLEINSKFHPPNLHFFYLI